VDWIIIPDRPLLSVLVWVIIAMVAGYLARASVIRLLDAITLSLRLVLRTQAKAMTRLAEHLERRNQDVLLEVGQQRLERRLDREFHQVWQLIDRDLAQFPHWQRQVSEHISQLEEDYHKTAETPPPAPDWLESISAVVRLKETQSGNPAVSKVLKDLESNLNRQHKTSLSDYRKSMGHRHRVLHSMMPQWRKLSHAIESVRTSIHNLLIQARQIDKHMGQYQRLLTGSNQVHRALRVSLFTEATVSIVMITLWVGIAWLAFELMNAPLQTLMAPTEPLLGLAMNEWAGLMLVGASVAIGLMLMELLRITRLFDGFYGLDVRIRRRLIWGLVSLLVLLALAQSGLVYLQYRSGQPATELARLIQYPVIVYEAPLLGQGLVLAARMLLAFILPFILIFIAVPFERLMHGVRLFLVAAVSLTLRVIALFLRLLSGWLIYANKAVQALYDVFISAPLWFAARFKSRDHQRDEATNESAQVRETI